MSALATELEQRPPTYEELEAERRQLEEEYRRSLDDIRNPSRRERLEQLLYANAAALDEAARQS